MFGQTAKRLHRQFLDGIFGACGQVWVLTNTPKDVCNHGLLCGVRHVHVEQLLIEARLFGQASVGQHFRRQHRGEWGRRCVRARGFVRAASEWFFLRRKFLLGEGLGCGTLRLTHAGETHLFLRTLCLLLRYERLQLRSLSFSLCLHRFGFCYGLFGQPHVVRTVDDSAFAVSQVRVGNAFTFEFRYKRFGDVLGLRLDDWQQQLKACVLSCFLLLALQPTGQFGKVGLELQALFLGLGFGFLAGYPSLGVLISLLQLLDLLGFQLVDHVAGLVVAFYSKGVCLSFGLFCNLFPCGGDLTEQVRLLRLECLLQSGFFTTSCKGAIKRRQPSQWVRGAQVFFTLACSAFFGLDILVVLGLGCDDGAVRQRHRGKWFGSVAQQLLFYGLGFRCRSFFVAPQRRTTSLAAYCHVNDQAGQCADSSAIGTFFAGTDEDFLLGVVHALGDQVLCNFLGCFR